MERFTKEPEQQLEIFQPNVLRNLAERSKLVEEKNSLNLEPFIDLYGKDQVTSDYGKIAERLIHFNQSPSSSESMGRIFESAFLDAGQRGHWFGARSELRRASKFDDILNGVDTIASISTEKNGVSHIAVASDLTFSHMSSSEKFNRIKSGVYGGKLAEIKYFHSDMLDFTGRLSNVPRTVIGLEPSNLNRFLLNWIREPELAQRQYGLVVLRQIATQSEALAQFARHKHVKDKYDQAATIVNDLIGREYQGIEAPEDKISQSLTAACNRL